MLLTFNDRLDSALHVAFYFPNISPTCEDLDCVMIDDDWKGNVVNLSKLKEELKLAART